MAACLWRWNRQSVPKRRHIQFRRRGITQKKTYNIQNTAKVWNQAWNYTTKNASWHNKIIPFFVIPLWEHQFSTPHFLTESPASLLPFVMWAHNSQPVNQPVALQLKNFLSPLITQSLTYSLPLSFSPCLPLHTFFSHSHWFSCPLTSTLSLSVTHSLFHSHLNSTC
jgi:hypothetical protein